MPRPRFSGCGRERPRRHGRPRRRFSHGDLSLSRRPGTGSSLKISVGDRPSWTAGDRGLAGRRAGKLAAAYHRDGNRDGTTRLVTSLRCRAQALTELGLGSDSDLPTATVTVTATVTDSEAVISHRWHGGGRRRPEWQAAARRLLSGALKKCFCATALQHSRGSCLLRESATRPQITDRVQME